MMMMQLSLENLWEVYNDEHSFWPLYLPLIIWIGSYVYAHTKQFPWHRWYVLHNVHNGGAIVLGTLSILSTSSTTDSIAMFHGFSERIPILWSLGYFGLDILDCAYRRDWTYLAHGLFCFVLGMFNYHHPIMRELRMNSKATYCELSNPWMHLARKTRKAAHFGMFALVFTLCRIFWLPVLFYQLYVAGISIRHPIAITLCGFYSLNMFWYIKIWRILLQGKSGHVVQKEIKQE
jgi:hypothetical protein